MAAKSTVLVTANFERNLVEIREFLVSAGAPEAFESLIERHSSVLIPMLERFSDLGADFLARAPLSVDGTALFESVVQLAGRDARIRQLIQDDYLVLYLVKGQSIYLLSIKHHRQLSFDLGGHWP